MNSRLILGSMRISPFPASIITSFTPENPIRASIGAFELEFKTVSRPAYQRIKKVFLEEDMAYQRTGDYHMGKILSAIFSEGFDVDVSFRYTHMKTRDLKDRIYNKEFLPFIRKMEMLAAGKKETA